MQRKKKGKKKISSLIKSHPAILKTDLSILESIAKRKHHVEQKMERFVAYTAMLLLIFTNALGAILLIPFLLFFQGFGQYAVVAVFAVGFGLIFNFMIHSIEHLGDKHHIIAGVVIPFFCLLDIIILFTLLEKIAQYFKIDAQYNYIFIVVLFILAFLVPYMIDVVRGAHRIKKSSFSAQ